MNNILDRSNTYLRIFVDTFQIDKNLPKWRRISEQNKESLKAASGNLSLGESPRDPNAPKGKEISIVDFLNLNGKDFNIYIGKRLADNIGVKSANILGDMSLPIAASNRKGSNPNIFRKAFIRFNIDKNKEEEVVELDLLKFFDQVKLTAKENGSKYVERIKPYMIALKRANDMGQVALADKLSEQIFNNKFESILHAEGFDYKISESQIVSFVKKTEKGVRLDYIKNFTRFIPDEVFEKKQKADSLLVFDNYCVLYYDPDLKSFKQTKEEQERERRKKSDPILFGMIQGSRNLYYIADWIDQYCGLTIDEFIRVTGLDKKEISITEKIML